MERAEKSSSMGRRGRHPGEALVDLLREVGPFALVGLAGSALLLLFFAKLSEEVFTRETDSFDVNASLWVHSFAGAGLDALFHALSFIGGAFGVAGITLIIFGLLLWLKRPHDAWRVVLAVGGGLVLNQVLKIVFQRPRPDLWVNATDQVAGFSFPSGHSTISFCLFGLLSWLAWQHVRSLALRLVASIVLALLIVGVGLSRIYLGAHYPSDVLAGYISGGFWLVSLLSGTDIYDRMRSAAANARSG